MVAGDICSQHRQYFNKPLGDVVLHFSLSQFSCRPTGLSTAPSKLGTWESAVCIRIESRIESAVGPTVAISI